MKLLTIIPLVFFIVGFPPVRTSDGVSVETIEKAQKSVVPIMCVRVNEKKEIQTRVTVGTGFFINRMGDLLTAGHVVAELKRLSSQPNPCTRVIYAPKRHWKERYDGSDTGLVIFALGNCHYREAVDIGVCKVLVNPFLDESVKQYIAPVTLASYTKYSDGSAIAFTGFPLQFIYPITSKGYIASYDPDNKRTLIDKIAWPGASGSPLYTADGKVIAIVIQQGTDKSVGLSIARPTDFALDLLREQKISVEK